MAKKLPKHVKIFGKRVKTTTYRNWTIAAIAVGIVAYEYARRQRAARAHSAELLRQHMSGIPAYAVPVDGLGQNAMGRILGAAR